MTRDEIIELVAEIAHECGINVNYALRKCMIESAFDPRAKNPSGAAGLFQIMPFHKVHPVFDPEINTRWAMRYAQQNSSFLEKNGLPVNATTLYLAHQQGPAGIRRILRGAAQEETIDDLPPDIERNVRHNIPSGARVSTCQDFIDAWHHHIQNKKLPQRALELIAEYGDDDDTDDDNF